MDVSIEFEALRDVARIEQKTVRLKIVSAIERLQRVSPRHHQRIDDRTIVIRVSDHVIALDTSSEQEIRVLYVVTAPG